MSMSVNTIFDFLASAQQDVGKCRIYMIKRNIFNI